MVRHKSRGVQAFEALMEPDVDEPPSSRGKKRGSSSKRRTATASMAVPGFRLRNESPPPASSDPTPSPSNNNNSSRNKPDIQQLIELFGHQLPHDLIQDIYHSSGSSLDAAIDALLSVGGTPGHQPPSNAPSTTTEEGPSTSTFNLQAQDKVKGQPSGPCYWDGLPTECKHLILSHLSAKDLAIAAGTSKELATHARTTRTFVKLVAVPEGVSGKAVAGLVASYASASVVDLTRWARGYRKSVTLEHAMDDVLGAIVLGEERRHTGVPVTKFVLKDSDMVDTTAVHAVCTHLRHLTSIDFSYCLGIGDSELRLLARYRQDFVVNSDNDDDDASDSYQTRGAIESSMAGISLGDHSHRVETSSIQTASSSRGIGCGPFEPSAAAAASTTRSLETPAEAVTRIAAAKHQATAQRRINHIAAKTQHSYDAATRGLQEMKLVGTGVTTVGVRELFKGQGALPSLQVLDVSRCKSVGGDALELGPRCALRVLKAARCSSIRSVTIQLPGSSPLAELSLADCSNLVEVTVVAPKLQDLNVSGCRTLGILSLQCPKLTRIRAAKCGALVLGVQHTLFECPSLEVLNIAGCRSLNAMCLEAILPSFAATVKEMDLSGCTGLSRVLIPEAAELQGVKVDGCSRLQRVAIGGSPKLTSFSAKGSELLQEVRVQGGPGTRFAVIDLENCAQLANVVVSGGEGGATRDSYVKGEGKGTLNMRGCPLLSARIRSELRGSML